LLSGKVFFIFPVAKPLAFVLWVLKERNDTQGMFPAKYGHVIDFMHIYDEDLETIGDSIEWLPEPEAKLITN